MKRLEISLNKKNLTEKRSDIIYCNRMKQECVNCMKQFSKNCKHRQLKRVLND